MSIKVKVKTRLFSLLIVAFFFWSCSSKSNPSSTTNPVSSFPRSYHGTSAYFAGDTLGTEFGVDTTIMNIAQADSLFNANGTDTLKLHNISAVTDFNVVGQATDKNQLMYNVLFNDGSGGIAIFNYANKDSLTITLQSLLTTKFGTQYERIYKVRK